MTRQKDRLRRLALVELTRDPAPPEYQYAPQNRQQRRQMQRELQRRRLDRNNGGR